MFFSRKFFETLENFKSNEYVFSDLHLEDGSLVE